MRWKSRRISGGAIPATDRQMHDAVAVWSVGLQPRQNDDISVVYPDLVTFGALERFKKLRLVDVRRQLADVRKLCVDMLLAQRDVLAADERLPICARRRGHDDCTSSFGGLQLDELLGAVDDRRRHVEARRIVEPEAVRKPEAPDSGDRPFRERSARRRNAVRCPARPDRRRRRCRSSCGRQRSYRPWRCTRRFPRHVRVGSKTACRCGTGSCRKGGQDRSASRQTELRRERDH